MSFVRLSNGDFPPLNQPNQNKKIEKSSSQKKDNKLEKIQFDNWIPSNSYKDNNHNLHYKDQIIEKQCSTSSDNSQNSLTDSHPGSNFLHCRVGVQSVHFKENLESVLDEYKIGHFGDFILTPIEPIRRTFYDDDVQPLSDLALPSHIWESKVALSLGQSPIDWYSQDSIRRFEKLFKYALYLLSPVVIIDCPNSNLARLTMASIVNDYLRSRICGPIILFKTYIQADSLNNSEFSWVQPLKQKSEFKTRLENKFTDNEQVLSQEKQLSNEQQKKLSPLTSDICDDITSSESVSENQELCFDEKPWSNSDDDYENKVKQYNSSKCNSSAWTLWNNIRSHINCDKKVGVCLDICDTFLDDTEEGLDVWLGEPVRMIIIHVDQFIHSSEDYGLSTLKLNQKCKTFIEKVLLANSLNTSIVIQGNNYTEDLKEYVIYLDCFTNDLLKKYQNALLDWNDRLQCPLQPLSSNLDSGTYSVFEADSMKYSRYKDAMIEAINVLLKKENHKKKKYNIMVLGAGRGPLVDKFIEALESIDGSKKDSKFMIFALDKNPCSIHSLKYKQSLYWHSKDGLFDTEVVESDMRDWRPCVKADIIITELLGSFSDNELSPECIDGSWKLTSQHTISIPQEYTSYITPICSHKLYSKLCQNNNSYNHVFDQIYVVRLANFYSIAEPQRLFKFVHTGNLNQPPSTRCNERYERLVFWSSTDTVCHGFAGYFMSKLFGSITISTVHTNKTPGMESWFPAFVPLESPIQMPRNTKLELHFWRKESSTSVWYEWAVTEPIRSRIYSPKGVSTAMSKFI